MEYNNLYIVGLGASAGGFEALQKFIKHIEKDDKIAYVITQHLDPKQPTLLGNLLSRYTTLDIQVITDGLTPQANNIYFCPPNKDLILKDGKFILTEPKEKRIYPKPSINTFFESIATEKKDKAIGVILSGTGNDGSEGAKAIHQNGGIVLAEDEGAKYFSMPKSAIDTGIVDAILPPELLSEGIKHIIIDRKYFEKHFEVQNSIEKIFDILNKKTSIDFSSYKDNTIFRRISKRLNDTKCCGVDEYIQLLNKDPLEIDRLKDELLIIVTSFFRDREAFFVLKKELKKLITDKTDNTLRVWIPACATGEEAYTVAIILHEILDELNLKMKVTIFATDVSDGAIKDARTNTFVKEDLLNVEQKTIEKYFENKNGSYRPIQNIRDMILFSKHDIIKDPPFLNLDFVSCRNLLIYFNNELQKRVMNIFYYSLRHDSILFLGQSETVGNNSILFSIVNNKYKIYKKSNDLNSVQIDTLAYKNYLKTFKPNTKQLTDSAKITDVNLALNDAIAKEYAQNGIIVDGYTNTILYYKGDCSKYLTHPKGLNSNDVFRLIADYLKLDLRATLNEANKTKKFTTSKKIKVFPIQDKKLYTTICVFPVEKNKLGDNTFFVTFDDMEIKESVFHSTDERFTPINTQEVNILEDELLSLKEKLQITIEELETSNEELQSTNEELQSTNEELQSTNEELETSNEELHSTNEELQTVNDELLYKNMELEFTNSAFNSVLTAIDADVIIVDEKLNIIKYTNGITKFFRLDGIPINISTLLLNSKLDLSNMVEDIRNCIYNGEDIGHEIKFSDKIYWYSIKLIDMLYSKNNNKGIVISFVDKTEVVKRDQLLFQQSKMASMGEMIGNIAHQWRQPLNQISLEKDCLVEDFYDSVLSNEKIEKFSSNITQTLEYMSKTIDDFRDFFHQEKEKVEFFVQLAIQDAVKLVSATLKNNNIDIKLEFNDENAKLFGYPNEFKQVLINIINNSKDAIVMNNTKNGFIHIVQKTIDNRLVIKIFDNGGGIPHNILEKIFEPYFTTKFKSKGTGIGLYMSKTIIEDHFVGTLVAQNIENGALLIIDIPKI